MQQARGLIGSAHKLYRGALAFYLRTEAEREPFQLHDFPVNQLDGIHDKNVKVTADASSASSAAGALAEARCFGVTQKPMYLPSIKRIWASRAGIEPKIIKVTGKNTH